MLCELALVAGIITVSYHRYNIDKINARNEKKDIVRKWWKLLDAKGTNIRNDIDDEFQILNIFPKHYGWDMIISIPYAKEYNDILKLINELEHIYKAEIRSQLSADRNTAYVSVHQLDKEIDVIEDVKFKWFRHFYNLKDGTNKMGESYKLLKAKDIVNPLNKDDILGTQFEVDIPSGLTYDTLKRQDIELSKIFGIVQISYDHKTKVTNCEIINKRVADDVPYTPISVEPYELFVGLQHNYKPIILSMKECPNVLCSGRVGSGKTVSVITSLLNLVLTNKDNIELFFCAMSEKQDLAMFRDVPCTQYYSTDKFTTISLLEYIKGEMKRRNKLFQEQEMCFNIYTYNKIVSEEERLKFIYVVADECADLMEVDGVQELLFDLLRKARSSGIYFIFASQRFSLANINPESKSNLCSKVLFKMSNTASANTVADNLTQQIVNLPPAREFVADYQEGVYQGKTLQLTEEQMIEYIKPHIDKEHKLLDFNKKTSKNEQKIVKNDEFLVENDQKNAKNNKKTPRFSKINNKK